MLSYLRVNMQTTLITDIYIFIITIWNAIINIYHKLTSRDLCDHVILLFIDICQECDKLDRLLLILRFVLIKNCNTLTLFYLIYIVIQK